MMTLHFINLLTVVCLQETLFNGIAAVLYLGASSYLALKVQTELWPQYVVTPYFQVYPALTAAYVSADLSDN